MMKYDQTYNIKTPSITWSNVHIYQCSCYQVFGATVYVWCKAPTAKTIRFIPNVARFLMLKKPIARRNPQVLKIIFRFHHRPGFCPKRWTNCVQSFGKRFIGAIGGSKVYWWRIFFACWTVGLLQLLINRKMVGWWIYRHVYYLLW